MPDREEQWAVFWCSLLSPLLYGEIAPEEAGRFIDQPAVSEQVFPDGQRRRPSRATLWRKWKRYRDGGFEALFRKRRKDRGQPRRAAPAMIAKAVELKTEQPYRSDVPINRFLQAEFGRTIPKSTLYRHLKRAGATRRKLGIGRQKVRCRWTRDYSNALWLGDFEDGPYVLVDGVACATHLSAFIDCHSRYVVEARYYLRENLDILIDSLLRAWSVHGASRERYLDNAKIYHAQALKAVCFALNLRLLHRGVGDPPPGGLIERFFETAQGPFESEVRAGEILTLDRLNQALTDIRLLVRSALDDAPPLKVVLAGQEPLRQTLRQSLHAALLNRISVRFHLAPLSKEQTAAYIDFQLKQSGGSEKLFDAAAKGLIHDYSGGVPRQINNLATACLLSAASQKATRINEAILQQTLSEFQLP